MENYSNSTNSGLSSTNSSTSGSTSATTATTSSTPTNPETSQRWKKVEPSPEQQWKRHADKGSASSIYYFWKSGAGRFPSLMPDSIDDFRQNSANAVDGEVRKERKDVT